MNNFSDTIPASKAKTHFSKLLKRIREQHEGGMKVNTEKFKSLLESKLGDSKPLISDDNVNISEDNQEN